MVAARVGKREEMMRMGFVRWTGGIRSRLRNLMLLL